MQGTQASISTAFILGGNPLNKLTPPVHNYFWGTWGGVFAGSRLGRGWIWVRSKVRLKRVIPEDRVDLGACLSQDLQALRIGGRPFRRPRFVDPERGGVEEPVHGEALGHLRAG